MDSHTVSFSVAHEVYRLTLNKDGLLLSMQFYHRRSLTHTVTLTLQFGAKSVKSIRVCGSHCSPPQMPEMSTSLRTALSSFGKISGGSARSQIPAPTSCAFSLLLLSFLLFRASGNLLSRPQKLLLSHQEEARERRGSGVAQAFLDPLSHTAVQVFLPHPRSHQPRHPAPPSRRYQR